MRFWILAGFVFFGYAVVLAPLLPGLPRVARRRAVLTALAGLGLCLIAHFADTVVLLREWLMPPALLLVGYWTSGQLFAAPMPGVERALDGLDRKLGVDAAVRATPRWLQ